METIIEDGIEIEAEESMPETGLVVIDTHPEKHETYIALKKEVDDLCRCINGAVVDSDAAVMRITTDTTLGRQILVKIDKARVVDKAPALEAGRLIEAAYKVLSGPLEEATANRTGTAAKKVTAYTQEQERKQAAIRAENERKIREAKAAQDKIDAENARIAREAAEKQAAIKAENERRLAEQTIDAKGTITGPELIAPEPEPEFIPSAAAPVLEAPTQKLDKAFSDFGSSTVKKVPVWEVTDFAKLPDRFKKVDETALRAAIEKAKERDIPGVKIDMVPATDFRAKSRK
jgi:hypothetical protein